MFRARCGERTELPHPLWKWYLPSASKCLPTRKLSQLCSLRIFMEGFLTWAWSFIYSISSPSSCPLNWWCHPTISSSVTLFSFCLQSFLASGSSPSPLSGDWMMGLKIPSFTSWCGLSGDQQYPGATQEPTESPLLEQKMPPVLLSLRNLQGVDNSVSGMGTKMQFLSMIPQLLFWVFV